MSESHSVLICSLDGEVSPDFHDRLRANHLSCCLVTSVDRAERELLRHHYPVLLIRSHQIDTPCLHFLAFIQQHRVTTRILVEAREGGVAQAVEIMKSGAANIMLSPSNSQRLEAILQAFNRCNANNGESFSGSVRLTTESESPLLGKSPSICELRTAISLVAKSETAVLVTGESGTGKEIVARHIHRQSKRIYKPFVALNCAALPKDVLENELFGHEKGAFTGALSHKSGCFELANEGTIFFDEIAEMSSEIQAKLLRAIELMTFRRLGGKDEIKVDVRPIAATNKNVSVALRSGELREDLYYRLSTIELALPPLRERKEDIPLLSGSFLKQFREKYGKALEEFSEECLELMVAYEWPGNVRELRNVVERAVIMCPGDRIAPEHLPHRISGLHRTNHFISLPLGITTAEAERIVILQTLASVQHNKSRAARILGLSRKTLHNKLQIFAEGSNGNETWAGSLEATASHSPGTNVVSGA